MTLNATSYDSLDDILSNYGSNIYLDTFNLYPFTIISILAFLTSSFSLLVFMNSAEFDNIRLFVYLRVYSANNMVLCFLNIFNFTYSSIRIIEWTNSFGSQVYYNYVYAPVTGLSYFYASALDILVLLDRISFFNNSLRQSRFNQMKPMNLCLVTFLACAVLNIPYDLLFSPGEVVAVLNSTQNYTIWYSATTSLSQTVVGQVFQYFNIAVRDILLAAVEIYLNVLSASLLKKHLNKKRRISTARSEATVTALMTVFHVKQRSVSIQITAADQRATIMVLLMCSMSFVEHVLNIANIIYPMIRTDLNTFILYSVCNFASPLKRLLLFFIFLEFNKKFRQVAAKYLRIRRASDDL